MRPREIAGRVLSTDLSGVNGRRDPVKPDPAVSRYRLADLLLRVCQGGREHPSDEETLDANGRSGASTSNRPLSVRVAFDPSGHKRSATACGLGDANSAERYRFFSSRQPWSSTNVPSIAAAP
jgi:hypothetical protein